MANDDEALDRFARLIAGFVMQDVDVDNAIRVEWRKVCRALGHLEEAHPNHLLFSSPNVMAAFTQHATTLPELTAQGAMAAGVTVSLGARPSVGAGLWLQGGIGHLARLHGLACDAIVGAVVVSVDSSQVLCVGRVPSQHQPASAIRPENESDLLWAMKGAGTNFGIVVSVTFKAAHCRSFSLFLREML